MNKKIIAVVGATGAQGGGLVRAILNDPSGGFTACAITRDVNSEEFCGARSLEVSRSLNPERETFEAWVTANQTSIPIQ